MSKTNLPRLTRKWLPIVEQYKNCASLRSQADRTARNAKAQADALKEQIKEQMHGAPAALCGQYLINLNHTNPSQATLTLADGTQVAISDIRHIVLNDGRKIASNDIAKIYGGRDGYDNLAVEEI